LLSGAYTLAIDNGHLLVNPCRKVRRLDEDNERARVLSHEEERRLMEQCTGRRKHLGRVIQLAIHTMLRRTELLSLRKEALDFERGLVWVLNSRRERTKSKRSRAVPMNSAALSILRELCEKSEGEYLFPNIKMGGYIKDVKTAFNSACEDAGIDGLTFHDLRRTGATRLGEGGANAFYISAVLGHADVKTSEIYTIASNEGLRRAMESLVSHKGSPYLSPAATKTAAG
jgi:integrase